MTTPATVWHYTNASGLLGILASGSLWASTPISLNDTTELLFGNDILHTEFDATHPPDQVQDGTDQDPLPMGPWEGIRRVFKGGFDLVNARRLVYILSTSSESDDLTQWRGYAGGQGYAIGIDTSVPLFAADDAYLSQPDEASDWLPRPGWREVAYEPAEQAALAREALLRAVEAGGGDKGMLARVVHIQQVLIEAALTMKHRGFAAEKEHRFIYSMHGDPTDFRSGPLGLSPFVRLTTGGRLPIVGIVCGPNGGAANADAEDSVRALLRKYDYSIPTDEVRSSIIPFRGP